MIIKLKPITIMKEIKLDEEKLQAMAEQYAIKGAEQAIKDFYTGYKSPFMAEIQRQLDEKMKMNLFFEIPTMTAAINQAINDKISEMANTVVAQTFLPMLNRMFSDERKTVVSTQDLYQHFGDTMKEDEGDDFDGEYLEIQIRDHSDEYSQHKKLSFLYRGEEKYELSMMSCHKNETDENGNTLFMITYLPGCSQYRFDSYPRERQMRIRLDEGATLEMPFVPDVLRDEFMRYVAGLLICNTKVVISSYHDYEDEED